MLRVKNDKLGIYPRVKGIMVNYKIRTHYEIMISDLQIE